MSEIVKNFLYEGLGFPFELHNVEMVRVLNELNPKINVKAVSDQAMQFLLQTDVPLTGNQLTFMRTYFFLDQHKFAQLFNATIVDVKKWEAKENEPAIQDNAVEAKLKQLIQEHLMKMQKEKTHLLSKRGLFSASDKKPKLEDENKNQIRKKPKK